MNENNNKDRKINKILLITGIILIITVIITLFIILNKGKIFGYRLVAISEEETHTIELVLSNTYLFVDGEEMELYVTIDGEYVTEGYEVVISDEEVILIEENVITPLEEGIATITVLSSEYDIQSEVTISVVEPITKLTIESEYTKIEIGEETQISYEYEPTDASVNIEYASTDEEIATVSEKGIVTGISEGSVTIIATDSITGKSASCNITVEE